jgi:flagellar hook protein FlgE
MGGSFFIGLSGLTANSMGIENVGNNIANTNTIGFKINNLFFEELNAASNGVQGEATGNGVVPAAVQQVWTQGNIQQSQVPTDMAIQGGGFFVVGDGVNSQFYTRAGNFLVDREGQLVTNDGMLVLGYPAVNGTVATDSDLSPIILTPGKLLPAETTSLIRFVTNLNSETLDGEGFSSSTVVFDSLGASHAVTARYTKTPAGWDYELTVPAIDVGGAVGDPPTVIDSGAMTFDSNGVLTVPAADVTGITISGFANGASDLTFDWDLHNTDGTTNLTQFNLPSSTSETFQDGNGAGTLSGVIVNADGVIEGLFSNGETSPLAQVALASFTNPQGMIRVGDNLYARTTASGEPTIGTPSSGGRGSVQGNALEVSNVDIAEEFIKLIIYQRGYQANSRVITTSDQITVEALQLKQ